MDIEEFHSWIYDDPRFPKRFYAFADIPNITNSGNSQYATCNLCSYVTDEQPFFTEEYMDKIMDQLISHVFAKHYFEAMNMVKKIEALEIAKRPGQRTLCLEEQQEKKE